MIRNRFSRREFIGLSAAAAGASLGPKTILLDPDPLWALPQAVAASDRVRFGIIGVGMAGLGSAFQCQSSFRESNVSPPAIFTTAANSGEGNRRAPICRPRGAIRNCWTIRKSTASSPPFPTTGTSRSWSMP